MKRYSLGILQSHPTQFDGPLFRVLEGEPDIDLTVYFFGGIQEEPCYDSEIGRSPGWSADITSGYRYRALPDSGVGCLRELWSACSRASHDLIVIAGYNSWCTLAALAMCRISRVPAGLRADNVDIRGNDSVRSTLKNAVLRRLFRLYETGHPTGELAKRRMTHYGFREDQLYVFPYAVDHERLRRRLVSGLAKRDSARATMKIDRRDFVFLGVMKFVEREDPLTLLRAFGALSRKWPKAHLVMVGDGHLRGAVEDFIRQTGLRNVHLPGYVDYIELPGYFAIADAFVHPAVREPWGVSVNEAMVCGLPVIAADGVGSSVDLIEVGCTGSIFPSGNAEALTKEMEKMICDSGRAHEMGSRARERVENWGYARAVSELRRALEGVGGNRRRKG